MKNFSKRVLIILTTVSIFLGTSVFAGCNNKFDNQSSEPTINVQTEIDNQTILKKADNNINAATIAYRCNLNDFKKYNISKDVYSRITSSVYISDIEKDIGIPALRQVGSVYYSVHPLKDNDNASIYGFVMYNSNGKVIDGWVTDKLHKILDFSDLKQGDNHNKVSQIDPYHCFMENISENTATSYHKLPDGKQYIIQYNRKNKNSDYVITYARQKDDSCLFTKLLREIDTKLIE